MKKEGAARRKTTAAPFLRGNLMKRFISIMISIAVLLCFCTSFSADTVYRYGDYTLGVVSGADDYAFSIRSYNGDDAVVTVPSDYGGYPLIRIDSYAFATNTKVQEVILSDQITSIGDGAFAQCGSLTKLVIPGSVTQIGDNAFQACDQVVIYAPADSYAITYAKEHEIGYVCASVETYVLGDADGNGEITLMDATVIQRYLSNLPVSDPDIVVRNGDIEGEGIEVSDATWIQRHIAKMVIPYEVGKVVAIYPE